MHSNFGHTWNFCRKIKIVEIWYQACIKKTLEVSISSNANYYEWDGFFGWLEEFFPLSLISHEEIFTEIWFEDRNKEVLQIVWNDSFEISFFFAGESRNMTIFPDGQFHCRLFSMIWPSIKCITQSCSIKSVVSISHFCSKPIKLNVKSLKYA